MDMGEEKQELTKKEIFSNSFSNEANKHNEIGIEFYGEDEWSYISSIRTNILDEIIDKVTILSKLPNEIFSDIELDLENERKVRIIFIIKIDLDNPKLFEANYELYNAYTNVLLFETTSITVLSVRIREFERSWNQV